MWLPPVGQHIVDDVPVSKRIVAQKGGAKMHMRPRPVDPQSVITWDSMSKGEQCHRQAVRHSHTAQFFSFKHTHFFCETGIRP